MYRSISLSLILLAGVLVAQDSCESDADGDGWTTTDGDCDDRDADVHPGAAEVCDGVDNNCNEIIDDESDVCTDCQAGMCPIAAVRDGSLEEGIDFDYQYAPTSEGEGYLRANWDAVDSAVSYQLWIGTEPGASDLLEATDVGDVTATTIEGLTLVGAWEDVTYYISVAPVARNQTLGAASASDGVGVAELEFWDGSTTTELTRGFTEDWPTTGMTAFFGNHFFETVTIAEDVSVGVQGFGKEDEVAEGVGTDDAVVVSPGDGWLAIYANSITINGVITASGRGFGGGGGGGAGEPSSGQRGRGGSAGQGGAGGDGEGGSGAGGGGSPYGPGGYGSEGDGGSGHLSGGGSGSTACGGSAGRSTADGVVSDIGGTGGTASSGAAGAGGVGEFTNGGADGVDGCDNWSGGGGGGYGAGGGGGTQWTGSDTDSGGGGGGGTGGSGGEDTGNGAAGAGPFGGAGGVANVDSSRAGQPGTLGGYLSSEGNGDETTDWSLALGSGGGGGGGGYQEASGGGGAAGGGSLLLSAANDLTIGEDAYLLCNGAGGGGGGRDNGGSSTGAAGGDGAGGGLLLAGGSVTVEGTMSTRISARGGSGNTTNGGTIKLFYDTWTGPKPESTQAGRLYDAGEGSF